MNEKVFGSDNKGSIRDIPLPQSQEGTRLNLQDEQSLHTNTLDDWAGSKRKNKRLILKLLIGAIVVLFLFIMYSWLFHSASVEISHSEQNVQITNQEFTAVLQGSEGVPFIRPNSFTTNEILYLAGSKEENKQTKSTGMLTVYNTDSTEKNYIKNTRFQSPDGRIYRAFKRFTIPQGSLDNPGSTSVLVVAENPGEKYNSESGLTFTLPALKEQGDPSYTKVRAEQAEPLTGGFSGIVRVPTPADISEGKIRLNQRIKQSLIEEFNTLTSDDYLFSEEYITISDPVFTQQPDSDKGGINLKANATLHAVVFDKAIFSKYFAQQLLAKYNPEDEIIITNFDDLTMTIADDVDIQNSTEFSFTVLGEASFRWTLDKEQIGQSLAGKLVSHVDNGLVTGLENVSIVSADVSPFWRRSFPNKSSKIDITFVD